MKRFVLIMYSPDRQNNLGPYEVRMFDSLNLTTFTLLKLISEDIEAYSKSWGAKTPSTFREAVSAYSDALYSSADVLEFHDFAQGYPELAKKVLENPDDFI